jgi:hypothetical protein
MECLVGRESLPGHALHTAELRGTWGQTFFLNHTHSFSGTWGQRLLLALSCVILAKQVTFAALVFTRVKYGP